MLVVPCLPSKPPSWHTANFKVLFGSLCAPRTKCTHTHPVPTVERRRRTEPVFAHCATTAWRVFVSQSNSRALTLPCTRLSLSLSPSTLISPGHRTQTTHAPPSERELRDGGEGTSRWSDWGTGVPAGSNDDTSAVRSRCIPVLHGPSCVPNVLSVPNSPELTTCAWWFTRGGGGQHEE